MLHKKNNKKIKINSISTKLVMLLSLSATIALVLSFIAIFIYTFNENKTNRLEVLSVTTKIMGQNLVAAIEFDDKSSAIGILHTLSLIKGVEGAFIFKNINNVFASYSLNKQSDEKLLDIFHKIYKKNNIKLFFQYIDYNYIIVNQPVYLNKEYIATFCIVSNTNQLKNTIKDEGMLLLLVFVFTLLIIIMISQKMQKIITTPIFKMKEVIEDISLNKNFNVSIKSTNNDEFKILFDGFNYMIATIRESTQELEKTKQEIFEVHKHTKASIEYAALIQSAIIPEVSSFRRYFKDYFSIWHPKDLVGGDIYLFEELREDECILMVIDCTGHGVPGAFVTMLVKAIERQIIERIKNSDEVVSPAKLLSVFNSSMKHLLKQENHASVSNAGFDGSIIYYNKKDNIIKCSSSRNDIFYFQNDELHVLKGDRQSVGYKDSDINYKFTEYSIDTRDEVTLYALTDGFIDQNGGHKDLPYGKVRLKKLLYEIYKESMADQQEEFLYAFEMYRDQSDVNDDLTVIGFKV